MTAADYEALEARVAALEQEMRHALPPKVDAVSWAVGLVHQEIRDFREETRATLGLHGEQLARHSDMLEEILRRLPPPES